jgi:hypothetical protein
MTNQQLDTWAEVEEAIREAFPGPSRKKFRAEIRRVAAEKQSIVGVWHRLATTALGDAAMREIERALERHRRKVEGASLAAATPTGRRREVQHDDAGQAIGQQDAGRRPQSKGFIMSKELKLKDPASEGAFTWKQADVSRVMGALGREAIAGRFNMKTWEGEIIRVTVAGKERDVLPKYFGRVLKQWQDLGGTT